MQFGAVAAITTAPFALALGGVLVLAFVFFVAVPNRQVRSLRLTATTT